MIGLERRRPVRTRASAVYHRAVVPVTEGAEGELAVDLACRFVEEHAVVVALAAIEIPLELPLQVPARSEEARARKLLERALAIGASYGVHVTPHMVRTRSAADAILDEIAHERAEIVVLALRPGRVDRTTAFVLKHASCRVVLASSPRWP